MRLRKAQFDVVKSVVAPRLARTPSNFCDTAQLFDMTLAECELGEKFNDTIYKTPSREAARRVQTTTLAGSILTRSIMYPSLPDVRDPFGKAGELKPTRVTEAVIRKFHSHMKAQLQSAVKSVMEAEPLGWVKDMDGDLHDPERLSKLVAKKMGLPAGAFRSLSMRNHHRTRRADPRRAVEGLRRPRARRGGDARRVEVPMEPRAVVARAPPQATRRRPEEREGDRDRPRGVEPPLRDRRACPVCPRGRRTT